MNLSSKVIFILLLGLFALPAMAKPFVPFRPYQPPDFSFVIGVGTSHGGDEVGGLVLFPENSTNYYSEDLVTLGGEQAYFLGAIFSLRNNAEFWLTYAKVSDQSTYRERVESVVPNTGDPNFDHKLQRDRYEFLYFLKADHFRIGAGAVVDRNIVLQQNGSTYRITHNYDDAHGWELGVGLDIPFTESKAAIRMDLRYIRMDYRIGGLQQNANSVGYFLSASFY